MANEQVDSSSPADFERVATQCFHFLVAELGMKQSPLRSVGGDDPRDSALVVRYTRDDMRIDIGWGANELALIVGVTFNRPGLNRRERHVYFEPFIEFLSQGQQSAIVPYVTNHMTTAQLLKLSDKRHAVFEKGLLGVAKDLSNRVKANFNLLESATLEEIRKHHKWMSAR